MRARKHVMSGEEILNELKFLKKPFPMAAVKAASEMKSLATGLIEYLKFALENVDSLDPKFMGHIYALYLLAEYRNKEAYPYVLQIYRLSKIQLNSLIGDSLTEGLPQITASVFNGNLVDLFDIFEDKTLYEFSRTSAFQASLILMNQNLVDKDSVINYVDQKLKSAIQSSDGWLVTELGDAIMDYHIEHLYDLMRTAFDKGLVDTFCYSKNCFESAIANGMTAERNRHRLVNKAWEEMYWWHCFRL